MMSLLKVFHNKIVHLEGGGFLKNTLVTMIKSLKSDMLAELEQMLEMTKTVSYLMHTLVFFPVTVNTTVSQTLNDNTQPPPPPAPHTHFCAL